MASNRHLRTYFVFAITIFTFFSAIAVVLTLVIGQGSPTMLLFSVLPITLAGLIGGRIVGVAYTKPLEELAVKAQKVAKGDYEVRFTTDEGPREVVMIAKALDELSTSIHTTITELTAEEQRQIQFVSDVSHEIRTPLTAIRGAAETLVDGDVPPEVAQRFLTNIISESERLTRLANDLLTLQRIEGATGELPLKRLNPRAIVESSVDMLEPLLEEREAQLSIAGEAPDILGDSDRIHQVIANLIENASRFISKGGHVHVELSGVKGRSVITVSDDGPGFGDIDPSRLFDRFYRGDSSRCRGRGTGGTGLGLAIVKAIVTAHGGTVEAINLPNGGACFIVAFPSLPPAEGPVPDPFK